jgi:hypothetical protein
VTAADPKTSMDVKDTALQVTLESHFESEPSTRTDLFLRLKCLLVWRDLRLSGKVVSIYLRKCSSKCSTDTGDKPVFLTRGQDKLADRIMVSLFEWIFIMHNSLKLIIQ